VSSAFLLGWSCVSALSAQQSSTMIQGPTPSVLFTAQTLPGITTRLSDTAATNPQATHWQKGLVIGGVIGTVGIGGLAYALCEGLKETQESCVGPGVGGAAIGAVIGGTVGALIGGQFPKRSGTAPPVDSTGTSP
jgi:hypothetical protein